MAARGIKRHAAVCDCGDHAWVALTRGFVVFTDPSDLPVLSSSNWHAKIVRGSSLVYAETNKQNPKRTICIHRALMPNAEMVDHRDNDGLNNRRKNLRPCSHGDNMKNRRKLKSSTSRFKGVYWDRQTNKWRASIRADGKKIRLGWFNNEEDAADAYRRAAISLHGEFARAE